VTSRARKIYATKKWLIEQSGKAAAKRYRDTSRVGDAMYLMAQAFCECALASGRLGGEMYVTTSDGMEWNVSYNHFGRRNPKTGKIDMRFKREVFK
jgi:hypothetical protein